MLGCEVLSASMKGAVTFMKGAADVFSNFSLPLSTRSTLTLTSNQHSCVLRATKAPSVSSVRAEEWE